MPRIDEHLGAYKIFRSESILQTYKRVLILGALLMGKEVIFLQIVI